MLGKVTWNVPIALEQVLVAILGLMHNLLLLYLFASRIEDTLRIFSDRGSKIVSST